MSRKLVDPVHFFDSKGHSLLSKAHLEARIKELEAENAKLRRAVKRMSAKQADKPHPEAPPIIN